MKGIGTYWNGNQLWFDSLKGEGRDEGNNKNQSHLPKIKRPKTTTTKTNNIEFYPPSSESSAQQKTPTHRLMEFCNRQVTLKQHGSSSSLMKYFKSTG